MSKRGSPRPLDDSRLALPPDVVGLPIVSDEVWLAYRVQDVTASVAGALFGQHPWITAYQLWAAKSGRGAVEVKGRPEIDGDTITFPPAAKGHLFEPAAIEALRMLRPDWALTYPVKRYFRNRRHRIGATPDCLAIDPARPGVGVVQVKIVANDIFAEKWTDPDTGRVVPPLWIVIQAIVEARLTGASWAAIAVMRSSYTAVLSLVDVPLHERLWDALIVKVARFWAVVDGGGEPDPDYARDGEIIRRLYEEAVDGPLADLSTDRRVAEIIAIREPLKAAEKAGSEAKKAREPLDNELIHKLGNHESAIGPGGVIIKAPTVRRKPSRTAGGSFRPVKILPPADRRAGGAPPPSPGEF